MARKRCPHGRKTTGKKGCKKKPGPKTKSRTKRKSTKSRSASKSTFIIVKTKGNRLMFFRRKPKPTTTLKLRSTKRKGPSISATSVAIGTRAIGNDRKLWIVRPTRDGVKRWHRLSKRFFKLRAKYAHLIHG